jgi:hypothetical protein
VTAGMHLKTSFSQLWGCNDTEPEFAPFSPALNVSWQSFERLAMSESVVNKRVCRLAGVQTPETALLA